MKWPIGFSATGNVGNCWHRKTHIFYPFCISVRQEMTSAKLGSVKRSWLKYINLSLMFMVLCCASVMCFAQLDRGTISGIVTDPSGSAIAGAKVTVTNIAMGTQNSTVTTGVGRLYDPGLPAGQYSSRWLRPALPADPQRNHGFGWRDGDCRSETGCWARHDDDYGNGGCSSAPDRQPTEQYRSHHERDE